MNSIYNNFKIIEQLKGEEKLRKFSRLLSFILALSMLAICFTGCGKSSSGAADVTVKPGEATPRNETLYYAGIQFDAPTSFNPLNPNSASFPISSGNMARELTFETLFMYNELDGKMYHLLASDFKWNNDVCTVTMNKDAHWSDGKPLTADDVVYTFNLAKKYPAMSWSNFWQYLDSVTKKDNYTVEFKESATNKAPLMVEEALESVYIVPQHIWAPVEASVGNDATKLQNYSCNKPVGSGPYKMFYSSDAKIVLIRDDNYWGKAASMWGKLPTPKYIVHNIYKDNSSGDTALKQGQVDVSQNFTPNIQTFGPDVKTYLSKAPYYITSSIPALIVNVKKAGLDNAVVRKAIAECIDYQKIAQVAVSGYSDQVYPSLMVPGHEDSLIDKTQLSSLQWNLNNAADANKLLDSIGAKKGKDGIRVLNGKKLSFKVECPTGWSDYQGCLEIVAACSKSIGVDITTYFPQMQVWSNDYQTGNFDMLMDYYQGSGISSPWMRAYETMYSKGVSPIGKPTYYNYGRYSNPEADKLIEEIPTITDQAKLKQAWTDLNKIYLKDVPVIGLYYRPDEFCTYNTSVWKGFPVEGDNTNIPPQICCDGYGIAALYHISASK